MYACYAMYFVHHTYQKLNKYSLSQKYYDDADDKSQVTHKIEMLMHR